MCPSNKASDDDAHNAVRYEERNAVQGIYRTRRVAAAFVRTINGFISTHVKYGPHQRGHG